MRLLFRATGCLPDPTSRGATRAPVTASYRLHGNQVRFEVGGYDHSKQLIIDPVLSYHFSYLGGQRLRTSPGIAAPTGSPPQHLRSRRRQDRQCRCDLYVTGYTESANFPVKSAYETAPTKVPAGTPPSAFVTKFAPDGKSVIFSTYLGGTVGSDQATEVLPHGLESGNAVSWWEPRDPTIFQSPPALHCTVAMQPPSSRTAQMCKCRTVPAAEGSRHS